MRPESRILEETNTERLPWKERLVSLEEKDQSGVESTVYRTDRPWVLRAKSQMRGRHTSRESLAVGLASRNGRRVFITRFRIKNALSVHLRRIRSHTHSRNINKNRTLIRFLRFGRERGSRRFGRSGSGCGRPWRSAVHGKTYSD